MNSINTAWNLGNFTVGLVADVSDEIRDRLSNLGLKYLGLRNTEIDKILGGFETIGGKQKRRKDWKRNEVEYSDVLAAALAKSFESLELPVLDGEENAPKIATVAEVVKYERETAAIKYRDAKAVLVRHESANDLEAWAKAKFGFAGDTHGEDGEYSGELLAATHTFLKTLLQDV